MDATRHTLTRRDFVTSAAVAGTTLLAGQPARAAGPKSVGLALLGAAHMHTPMFLEILKIARGREDRLRLGSRRGAGRKTGRPVRRQGREDRCRGRSATPACRAS